MRTLNFSYDVYIYEGSEKVIKIKGRLDTKKFMVKPAWTLP